MAYKSKLLNKYTVTPKTEEEKKTASTGYKSKLLSSGKYTIQTQAQQTASPVTTTGGDLLRGLGGSSIALGAKSTLGTATPAANHSMAAAQRESQRRQAALQAELNALNPMQTTPWAAAPKGKELETMLQGASTAQLKGLRNDIANRLPSLSTQPGAYAATATQVKAVQSALDRQRDSAYYAQTAEKRQALEQVSQNPDFAAVAARTKGEMSRPGNLFTGDAKARNMVRDIQLLSRMEAGETGLDQVSEEARHLTEQQKNTLLYYAGTDQWDKASEYLEAIQRDVNAAKAAAQTEAVRAASEARPLMGAVGNIAASFATPAAWLGNIAQAAKNAVTGVYEPTDTNSELFAGARLAQATREGVSKGAEIGVEVAGKDVGSFLAETGLSIGQFLSKVPLGPLALGYMGASAAGETTYEALEGGATAGQAAILGTAAGLIEAATEKLGLDNLLDIAGGASKAGLRAVLSQMGTEAGEEAISEVANTLANLAVLGKNSDFSQYVDSLVQSGMSREEAEGQALKQFFLVNTAWAAAGGALSGGVTGAGGAVVSNLGTAPQMQAAEGQNKAASTEAGSENNSVERNGLAYEAIQRVLRTGKVNNTEANTIIQSEDLAQAFVDLTGIALEGTTEQKRVIIRNAARNAVALAQENEALAQTAALDAEADYKREQAELAEQRAREEDEKAVRNSGYRSYIRGIFLKGATTADAIEISRSPELRAEWESVTGKTLPQNEKSAVKMIRQTERNPQNITLQDPIKSREEMDGIDRFRERVKSISEQNKAAQMGLENISVKQKNKGETATIIQQLKENIGGLSKARPVASVSIADVNSAVGNTMAEKAEKLFERIKGVVTRKGFGAVEIDGRSVKDDLSHGVGPAKAAVIPAVPNVIQNGEQIDFQENWKGRGYNGYVFAAPVLIDVKGTGELETVYVAAVVTQTSKNRFYLHEVVDSNGNIIKISRENRANPTDLAANGDVGTQSSLLAPTISQNPGGVKSWEEMDGIDRFRELVKPESARFKRAEALPKAEAQPAAPAREMDEIDRFMERVKSISGQRAGGAAGAQREAVDPGASVGAAPYGFDPYSNALNRYGAIPEGENPARVVDVPKRTADDKKVSQTVRTVLEAQATPEEAIPTIEKMVAEGKFSYEVYGDEQARQDAEDFIINRGWGDASREWFKAMEKGEVSKRNTAVGWALYNNAANAGDMETAVDVLNAMVEYQRSAAQALQATRMLKKMSPEGQLYAVQKSVSRLQQEINDRYGSKGKNAPTLVIDPRLAEQLMSATDQAGRDEVMKEIYRSVGRQMPSRFMDKWNAWRYLAMLGNARTHVRNVVGNAGFAPVVGAKNLTATAIESAVDFVSGGKLERSKGLVTGFTKADRALLSAAWKDYANVSETVMGGGKYSDGVNANRYVEEGRQIFGKTEQARTAVGRAVSATAGKAVEAARRANSKALDKEDMWFSKPHYAAALASWCKANGVTAAQVEKGHGLDRARAYAMKEAQKATYRDVNALSSAIGSIGRYEGKNPVAKGISTVMEGILPFRKTPANVLARGLEYSPAGLLKSLTYDIRKVKRGEMAAADLIDDLSAGLTGSGLLAAGFALAAQGLIRGRGAGEEEERKFDQLQGHQDYSLELGDVSLTLDWLAPECLPFFVGVNLYETARETGGQATMSQWLTAIGNVTEPMMEMSCLQSLNDIFDAVGYAQSEGLSGLPSAIVSGAASYLTSGVPTLLGQIERSGQDKRMTTYTEKNSFLTQDMQYTLGGLSGKLPGWDYNQIEYVDAWGRTEDTGDPLDRIFNNAFNPAYTSAIEESDMERELERLYDATGDASVFPSRAAKYFNVEGERLDLTASQYTAYAKAKGQKSYQLMTELTASAAYQAMDDTEKAQAAGLVYDYANALAKAKVSGYEPEGWIKEAQEAVKATGISESRYLTLYLAQRGVSSLKDKDGESISNSKGLQIMELVYNAEGLTDRQRKQLFQDFGVGSSVIKYSKSQVERALREMRRG